MRTLPLLSLIFVASCATRPDSAETKMKAAIRERSAAAQARYWVRQAAERPMPEPNYELLPILRPERIDDDGIRRTAATDYLRIPRSP